MAEEVARELGGTWVLERSENVIEYLTELGVGACERKSFADDTATQTIDVTDDVIHLEMKYGKRHIKMDFKLGEEFIINAGKPSKARASWTNGALVITVRRVGCGRQQQIERKRNGDKLIQMALDFTAGSLVTYMKIKSTSLNTDANCHSEKLSEDKPLPNTGPATCIPVKFL
ncbi:fatty acid-binding protein 12-like [Mercenaria mercenaria]|uniref:fatty acid-binding protein 12-like n=1 Tax=Mercenaria mercenaria TaxID=6596 RepID=UPI00234E50B0|nr:fatty acid-binding protein 12-like [Mercenaria mercenaria]